jgi:hypothetical protein
MLHHKARPEALHSEHHPGPRVVPRKSRSAFADNDTGVTGGVPYLAELVDLGVGRDRAAFDIAELDGK